jgi:hypothetical protein
LGIETRCRCQRRDEGSLGRGGGRHGATEGGTTNALHCAALCVPVF